MMTCLMTAVVLSTGVCKRALCEFMSLWVNQLDDIKKITFKLACSRPSYKKLISFLIIERCTKMHCFNIPLTYHNLKNVIFKQVHSKHYSAHNLPQGTSPGTATYINYYSKLISHSFSKYCWTINVMQNLPKELEWEVDSSKHNLNRLTFHSNSVKIEFTIILNWDFVFPKEFSFRNRLIKTQFKLVRFLTHSQWARLRKFTLVFQWVLLKQLHIGQSHLTRIKTK